MAAAFILFAITTINWPLPITSMTLPFGQFMVVVSRGKPIMIIGECKSQGEPRYLRQAAEQLRDFLPQYPTA